MDEHTDAQMRLPFLGLLSEQELKGKFQLFMLDNMQLATMVVGGG